MKVHEQTELRKHHMSIVDNVDAAHLLDQLFQEDVIDMDDYQRISSGVTSKDRTRLLLQIIWGKPADRTHIFPRFIQILEQDYGFLQIVKDEKATRGSEATDGGVADIIEGADIAAAGAAAGVVAEPFVPLAAPQVNVIQPPQQPVDILTTLLEAARNMTETMGEITHNGRRLQYRLTGNFYKWQWVWQGYVTDAATGLEGRGKNRRGRNGALEDAIRDLSSQLMARQQ